ncbi:MAG: apolipoprotein N-acyltransferase, partial [Bacteroidota bacterium]
LLSGILLAISWPPFPLTFLLLFALIPLLIAEQNLIEQKGSTLQYLGLLFTCIFIWHLIGLQWIFGLGKVSALGIMIVDTLILLLFLLPAHFMKKAGKTQLGQLTFIAAWMSFDLLHLHWELAFPLLNLGNGLGRFPILIQWYEFTGVFGGTFWILLSNLLAYRVYQQYQVDGQLKLRSPKLRNLALVLLVPIVLSTILYFSYSENDRNLEVVVVHPNIDTRTERYITDQKELIDRYIQLSKKALTPTTDYLVWTENAITDGPWIEHIDEMQLLKMVRDSFADYPQTKIIVGSILYKLYRNGKPAQLPSGVTYAENLNQAYYTYSAAAQIDPGQQNILTRTKQELVPFEESAPYPSLLTWLRNIIGNFTGFTFSAAPKNQDVFYAKNEPHKVTPLICYESAFGSNTADYVKAGAQVLFVMLNEGWYHDWQGASQFLNFSVVRAVESRRSIARSSNDGISAFISPRGDIIEKQEAFTPDALRQKISINDKITIYNRFGDYLGWLALLFGMGAVVYFSSSRFLQPQKKAAPKKGVRPTQTEKGKKKKGKKK